MVRGARGCSDRLPRHSAAVARIRSLSRENIEDFCCTLEESRVSNASQSHSLSQQPPGKPRRPRPALLPLALILAIGTAAAAEDPPYTLVIKDHRFQPAEIEIPAGKKIALVVKNNDSSP